MALTEKQLEELKEKVSIREKIFISAKYYLKYYEFFSGLEMNLPEKHERSFLVNHLKFACLVVVVLELSKLFKDSEKHSFANLYKYFNQDSVISGNIKEICKKLNLLRDKYYAHTDSFKCDDTFGLNIQELKKVVTEAESILINIKRQYFQTDCNYNLTDCELGITFLAEVFDLEDIRQFRNR
jgi:hypothetical protein